MENPPIFHGTIHYFDWAIFNSKLFDITRPGRCHVDLIVFQHVSVHVLEIFEPFFEMTPDRWTTPGGITHSGLVDQVGLRAIFTIAVQKK